jgi:hypothetical protein
MINLFLVGSMTNLYVHHLERENPGDQNGSLVSERIGSTI